MIKVIIFCLRNVKYVVSVFLSTCVFRAFALYSTNKREAFAAGWHTSPSTPGSALRTPTSEAADAV